MNCFEQNLLLCFDDFSAIIGRQVGVMSNWTLFKVPMIRDLAEETVDQKPLIHQCIGLLLIGHNPKLSPNIEEALKSSKAYPSTVSSARSLIMGTLNKAIRHNPNLSPDYCRT